MDFMKNTKNLEDVQLISFGTYSDVYRATSKLHNNRSFFLIFFLNKKNNFF